jgi:Domain of unknown function (DUF1707)
MHAATLPVALRVARVAHSAVRVGDPERDRAAAALRHHFAAGRLEADELEDRLEQVFAARGRSDLRLALAGLPAERVRGAAVGFYGLQRRALRYHVATWATVNASLVGVWELVGAGLFWPAIVLVPTSTLLAAHGVGSRGLRRWLRL